MEPKNKKGRIPSLYVSLLLLMIAVAAATAATMAWMSIADSTRLRSMRMDITTGVSMRFDLDAHQTFEEYVKTLTFTQIAERIRRDKGFDITVTPLDPVTTSDYHTFTYERGDAAAADSGAYLEFELNFMASTDMVVHLTAKGGTAKELGTAVTSKNSAVPGTMRISFTTDGTTWIYNPSMGDSERKVTAGRMFGLPTADHMKYSDINAMFSLKASENKKVIVHVWMEGTDPACTDDLKGADYSISLRFEGTDENNQLFDVVE